MFSNLKNSLEYEFDGLISGNISRSSADRWADTWGTSNSNLPNSSKFQECGNW